MRMTYRYTTETGEGTFSATRRFLQNKSLRIVDSIVESLHREADWLVRPHLTDLPVEFYFTEEGKCRFEARLKAVQETCIGSIQLKTATYEELQGEIVYEDTYQIAVRAPWGSEQAASPYNDPTRYCF